MTPRLVIICSFVFACVIIVGGGIILGGKRHAQTGRAVSGTEMSVAVRPETPRAESSEPAQRERPKPDVQQDITQQDITKRDFAREAPAQRDAPAQDPTTQDSAKQDSANVDAPKQEPPKQESMQPDPGPQDVTQQESAPPLPIMITYELKKDRDAQGAVARNPKGFWIRQIVARIEDKKVELSKPLEQPAVVVVDFVIGHDGTLVSKTVGKSSGLEEADKTAIGMLERAQPFPPMPDGLSDTEASFSLPVRFR